MKLTFWRTAALVVATILFLAACGGEEKAPGTPTPGGARPVSYTHLTLPTNREV